MQYLLTTGCGGAQVFWNTLYIKHFKHEIWQESRIKGWVWRFQSLMSDLIISSPDLVILIYFDDQSDFLLFSLKKVHNFKEIKKSKKALLTSSLIIFK